MAQLQEIIQKEGERTTIQDFRTVHLYPEGSFLRAYEWSAWLWCRYVSDFKPTHRKVKSLEQSFVHIGCPSSSFVKHVPEGAIHHFDTDGTIHLEISPMAIPNDVDVVAMQSAFEQWKQEIPISESSSKRKTDGLVTTVGQQPTLSTIMQQILAYPIENKSLIESVSFLSDVKQQLAKLV